MNNNINNDTHQDNVIDEIDMVKVGGGIGIDEYPETPAPDGYEKTTVYDGADNSALCPLCNLAMAFTEVKFIRTSGDFYTFECKNTNCSEYNREYIKTFYTSEWFRKILK